MREGLELLKMRSSHWRRHLLKVIHGEIGHPSGRDHVRCPDIGATTLTMKAGMAETSSDKRLCLGTHHSASLASHELTAGRETFTMVVYCLITELVPNSS
jgi:hypothetical protein